MNKRRIVILVFLILLVITIAVSITLGSRRISLEMQSWLSKVFLIFFKSLVQPYFPLSYTAPKCI